MSCYCYLWAKYDVSETTMDYNKDLTQYTPSYREFDIARPKFGVIVENRDGCVWIMTNLIRRYSGTLSHDDETYQFQRGCAEKQPRWLCSKVVVVSCTIVEGVQTENTDEVDRNFYYPWYVLQKGTCSLRWARNQKLEPHRNQKSSC